MRGLTKSHVADSVKQILSYIRRWDSVLIVGPQPVEMARALFNALPIDAGLYITILNTTGKEIPGLDALQNSLKEEDRWCKELRIESFEYLCGPARYYHTNRFDVLLYILSENEDADEIVRQAKQLMCFRGGDIIIFRKVCAC